jgi:hypothetical protein
VDDAFEVRQLPEHREADGVAAIMRRGQHTNETKWEMGRRKVVWSLLRRHFKELIAAHPVDAERVVAEAEKQILGIALTPYPSQVVSAEPPKNEPGTGPG